MRSWRVFEAWNEKGVGLYKKGGRKERPCTCFVIVFGKWFGR